MTIILLSLLFCLLKGVDNDHNFPFFMVFSFERSDKLVSIGMGHLGAIFLLDIEKVSIVFSRFNWGDYPHNKVGKSTLGLLCSHGIEIRWK